MTQARRISFLEAIAQSTVGILLGIAVTIGFLGLDRIGEGVSITLTMFVVSSVRGYLIRRLFEAREWMS